MNIRVRFNVFILNTCHLRKDSYLFKLVVVVTNVVLSDLVVRDLTIGSFWGNLLKSGLVLNVGLSSGLSGDNSIGLTLSFLLFFLLLFPLGLT